MHLRFGARRLLHAGNAASSPKQLGSVNALNPLLKKMEYAVRGELVIKAEEFVDDLATGRVAHPFDEVVQCNIGNPQALQQKPVTFSRQVLSLMMNPELLENEAVVATMPADVVARAKTLLGACHSLGAYSHSKGVRHVRESVAKFIERRDGSPSNPENIFITDGASPAVQCVLRALIRSRVDGVMTPIPQYPLYSATIAMLGGSLVEYHLEEKNNWGMNMDNLQSSYHNALTNGIAPRALCVINPGNPTGGCLTENEIAEVLQFARERRLVVMADEVYQTNIYAPETRPFHSFKKILSKMDPSVRDHVELFSFHSVSKGMFGECGLRGGYMECVNVDAPIIDQLYKGVSVNLCSNVVGQMMVSLMADPPREGDPSYPLYNEEITSTYESLKRRATVLVDGLNAMEGVSCNRADGAMYAFPNITIPARAVAKAKELGKSPDTFYCLELLKGTGVCVVPGSGFGQEDGTWHFRTTFLPQEDKIQGVVERMAKWHAKFMQEYSS